MKDIDALKSKPPCNCNFCKRTREFERIAKKLPKRDREWLEGLYNHVVEIETELEMRNAHRN